MTSINKLTFALLALSSFFISYLFNSLLVRFAYRIKLIDKPNHRSSHSTPTPKGGGIGIVISFLGALLFIILHTADHRTYVLLFVSSLMVALIGLYDDIKPLSALSRLLVHVLALLIFIYFLPHYAVATFLGLGSFILSLIILLWCGTWLINLYNFMDGLDGLAIMEAIFICLMLILTFLIKHEYGIILNIAIILLASCTGFLLWNTPPAAIFMGDIGSGFLGLIFAEIIIYTVINKQISLVTWFIWLSLFWVDTTYTLIYRLIDKQKIFQAHRSHLCQILAQKFNSHAKVLLLALAYNCLWLTPLSIINNYNKHTLTHLLILIIAISPQLYLCWHYGAGKQKIGKMAK